MRFYRSFIDIKCIDMSKAGLNNFFFEESVSMKFYQSFIDIKYADMTLY